ncbi:Elongator complex protein 4 [Schizophyllum fasciatum]
MSSFKRKSTKQSAPVLPGTRPYPGSPSTIVTSTGIPSLDDILGGGLPLSCSTLIAAPDVHSSYGELVSKYFVSQGLVHGHTIYVVGDESEEWVKDCVWTREATPAFPGSLANTSADESSDAPAGPEDKIKIAWRYEQMKPFQTSVPTSANDDDFCEAAFDLTSTVPESIIREARASGRLVFINDPDGAVRALDRQLAVGNTGAPARICVPSLGSPWWGDLHRTDVLRFLHSLRGVLRRSPHACASICLAPHLAADKGLIERAGWMCDAALSLSAFTADPALSATFPSYHGLVTIHTLPAPHTVLPPSDKHSTLRGSGVSGENNLAFKCTRKRMLFETLHLDIEGGVGERRTTPAPASMGSVDVSETQSRPPHDATRESDKAQPGLAAVEVTVQVANPRDASKPKKAKKKVGFSSDW